MATPIFPQRQLVDMPQSVNASGGTGPPGVGGGIPQVTISSNAVSQTQGGTGQQVTIATAAQLSSAGQLPVGANATFQRIQSSSSGAHGSGQASVSVFRGDGSVSVQPASISTQQPPAAHSGSIALSGTPNVARPSTQPAPPAHITQTPITQPAGNIKPEPIGIALYNLEISRGHFWLPKFIPKSHTKFP